MEKRILRVKAHPRAKRREIIETGPDEYTVRVPSPPEKGAANREILELLASHLRVPVSCLAVLKGTKSRRKTISLEF